MNILYIIYNSNGINAINSAFINEENAERDE